MLMCIVLGATLTLNYKYKWKTKDDIEEACEEGYIVVLVLAFILWPLAIALLGGYLGVKLIHKYLIPD